ncbi:hypothetical protein BCR33DRAFT_770146 [Rhizoclosmatium globosum]|uniref:SGNH hydrolase n=1 Tax=Rhizoclosmatium globosum TaxID=329046 RepID=A0A1Y2BPW8_9FUNG|nr:hypothetical protein BCR33DRAFT_770146 [Rhizoclosmatium globosum]|eukprot:ORY36657.1 hypothetical protein BCR33DRAFT_770146 [Rhizoclosmatium globosum]
MISFLFAILASQLLSTAVFAQSAGIKTIVAFGGSVNDNGNFFSQYAFPPAPYWQGRFSNGPVWVEQLATLLKNATLLDFASIGACANVSNAGVSTVPGTKVPAASVPDLWKQYESHQNDTRAKGASLDTDLFTVFAGADDMLYAMGRGEVPDVVGIAGSVVKFVGALAKSGTKQILVANIPPLDLQLIAKRMIYPPFFIVEK